MTDNHDLGVAMPLRRGAPGASPHSDGGSHGLAALFTRHLGFLIVVLLPSLVAILYFGVIASDIYVSEARYVVRSTEQRQVGLLGNVLQNVGLATSQGDAYSVHDYILSRDAVRRLEATRDLRAILSRPEGDFISRFPPPFRGQSFEQLYKSYGNFVSVTVDETSGISTLRVRAFRPADAAAIARTLLSYSEELINRLNDRQRGDAVAVAERELAGYRDRVAASQAAVTAYRLRNQMLDPQHTSGAVLELMAQLSSQRAQAQTQLSEILRAAPESPQIPLLRQRIASLEAQVAAERSKIVGGNGSVAQSLSEYERLLLEREFADKSLLSANASLEAARLEAQRKLIYLERVVEPGEPDYPIYPQRWLAILEVICSALLVYGIGWLVAASVREHVGR